MAKAGTETARQIKELKEKLGYRTSAQVIRHAIQILHDGTMTWTKRETE